MALYRLEQAECPIAWPLAPTTYSVNASIASTSAAETVEAQESWLRDRYVRCLLAEHATRPDVRVLEFARDLRSRPARLSADTIKGFVLSSQVSATKWRGNIEASLPESEATLLKDAIAATEAIGSAAPKGKAPVWRANNKRELLKSLELVDLELQIVLLLELLMLSPPSERQPSTGHASSSPAKPHQNATADDPVALFELQADRLVVHQALSSFGDLLGDGPAADHDDTQAFWSKVVEALYAHALPAFLFTGIRSKLFANAPDGFSASPFHHPTPNLQRLDDAAVESRLAAQAAAGPASPTLAKLMGRSSQQQQVLSNGNVAGGPGKRTFQRSKSLASAIRRPLEVDMQPKRQKLTSVDHPSQSQDSQKPAATSRAHRRKQASPKLSKTLVADTPKRERVGPLSRVISMPSTFAELGASVRLGAASGIGGTAMVDGFDVFSSQQSGPSLPTFRATLALVPETPAKTKDPSAEMAHASDDDELPETPAKP